MASSSFLSMVFILSLMTAALALLTVSATGERPYDAAEMGWMRSGGGGAGLVGEAEEEFNSELMDSESNRRILAAARRYISYGALQRNSVPCLRRGRSYYNCRPGAPANPYTRGCSAITRCRR